MTYSVYRYLWKSNNCYYIVTYYYKLNYNNGKRTIFIITTDGVIKDVVENIDTVK